jgi:membrane associated rhomboid family serine protease
MMLIFCIICVVVYFLHPSPDVYGVSLHNLCGIFSYQFLHGNLLHLGINIASLLLLYKPFKIIYGNRFNYDNDVVLFLIIYAGSILAALVTPLSIPTVGASGMVFFILGAILGLRPTKQQFINYIWVFLGVIVSVIMGHSNTLLHIAAFLIGVLFAIIRVKYDNCRPENNRRLQTH